MIKLICLLISGILFCNNAFCITQRTAKYVAKTVAESVVYDYAADYVREECMPAIEAAADRVQDARAQHQKETSEMIKDAVEKEDYVGAAFIHEGSDRDPGDGCIII